MRQLVHEAEMTGRKEARVCLRPCDQMVECEGDADWTDGRDRESSLF